MKYILIAALLIVFVGCEENNKSGVAYGGLTDTVIVVDGQCSTLIPNIVHDTIYIHDTVYIKHINNINRVETINIGGN